MTKIQLKLISDADICLYFEKVMRGGASYISKRYSKANNKYLKSYDAKQEYKHIYLDANSLHCYEMSKLLPENGFKWIDFKKTLINSSSTGCSRSWSWIF